MNITEVIKELTRLQKGYGDELEVFIASKNTGVLEVIEEIEYQLIEGKIKVYIAS